MAPTNRQFEEFRQVIRRVLESPRSNFYREKFARAGFDPKRDLASPEDIVNVPRLSREEFAGTPVFLRLYADPAEIRFVRFTSGTSGAPLLMALRGQPRYAIPGARPLVLPISPHADIHYLLADRSAAPPTFPPVFGYHGERHDINAMVADRYDVDAVIGTPSRIIALANFLSPGRRDAIRALFMTGERLAPEQAAALCKRFPRAVLDPRYGFSELGFVGHQCDALRALPNVTYHAAPDYLVECTDPETGRPAAEGAEGEILITELYESPHQFIRYRTGDAGRIIRGSACACGAAFRFEITGRIDLDIIRIAGGVLRSDEIERVVIALGQWLEPDFRGRVEQHSAADGDRAAFRLQVILKPGVAPLPLTLNQIREAVASRLFLTPTKTLHDFQEGGRLTFTLEPVQAFEPSPKTQRLRLEEGHP